MNLGPNQPMGFVDDSQLIQSFAQFSLMNNNPYYGQQNMMDICQMQTPSNGNDGISLENNFSNYDGHLSSIPSHMKSQRLQRSHSINRIPESSTYIKENFLFEKLGEKTSKDDATIRNYQNPILLEEKEPTPIQKYKHLQPDDNLSNSSGTSMSSFVSFNESAS